MLSGSVPALLRPDPPPGVDHYLAQDAPPAIAEPPPFVVGVFDDMPAETYHAIEAMSSGGIKQIMRSSKHYRLMRTKKKPPTPAMIFGTAVHTGTLEPARFTETVIKSPGFGGSRIGKADATEFALLHAGKIILDADDYDRALRCIAELRAHPSVKLLLEGAIVERSLFWIDGRYKVPCKARWDIFTTTRILVDLKTTRDASEEDFALSIARYGYHTQAAHYCSAAEHLLDASPDAFLFIAIESDEPFGINCFELPGNAIAAGMRNMNLALGRYADALATGTWPGYSPQIKTIQLPRWALRFND